VSVLGLFRLDGRVAVVTGASSGLGVEIAVGLAEAGADVVVAARREDRLRDSAARIEALGRRALVVPTDITDPDQCARLIERTAAEMGRLDVLVNNAGIAPVVPASRETVAQFTATIAVDLVGAFAMSQAAAREMGKGASIVNISSVVAERGADLPQASYAAAKAGLLGLTRDLARQWTGRKGIRVNGLLPGLFESEITARHDPGYAGELLKRVPAGRFGTHAELAAAVVFLAGPASGYITGASLPVDGGYTIF
jgi:NAD(P)-dependent dehydrogenase (short-subunit alcohol dehydrogenase family)